MSEPRAFLDLVKAERERQITVEGYSAAHDDEHDAGELAAAAACYALPDNARDLLATLWPWDYRAWNPGDRRHALVKAAALLAAEYDRLVRAEVRRG